MAVTYIGAGALTGGTNVSSLTVPVHASTQAGDLILLTGVPGGAGSGGVSGNCSSWTERAFAYSATGFWWGFATGTGNITVTTTAAAATNVVMRAFTLRGTHPTTPFDSGDNLYPYQDSGTSHTGDANTAANGGCAELFFVVSRENLSGPTAVGGPITTYESGGSGSTGTVHCGYEMNVGAAGAKSSPTMTTGSSTTSYVMTALIRDAGLPTGTVARTLGAVTSAANAITPSTIAYVGAGTIVVGTNVTSRTVTVHANTQAGDLIIIGACNGTTATPSGNAASWTQVATGSGHTVWAGIATGTASVTVYTTNGSTTRAACKSFTFRNVAPSIFDPNNSSAIAASTGTSHSGTGITTACDNSAVVYLCQEIYENDAVTACGGSATNYVTGGNASGSINMAYGLNAGAAGAKSAPTQTTGNMLGGVHCTIWLRSANYPWAHLESTLGSVVASASATAGDSGVTGTVARTLDAATASAAATAHPAGVVAQTLGAVTATAAAKETFTGSLASTLSAATSSAAAILLGPATLARTLDAVTSSASAKETFAGTVGVTLGAVASTAAASEVFAGTLARTLATIASTAAATAAPAPSGTVAVTLGVVASTAAAKLTLSGALASTLGAVAATASAEAAPAPSGTLAETLGSVTATASASYTASGVSGGLARTLGDVTASAASVVHPVGSASATLGAVAATASASLAMVGSASVTLGAVTATATGTVAGVAVSGSASVTLGSVVANSTATSSPPATATLARTLAALTAASAGTVYWPAGTVVGVAARGYVNRTGLTLAPKKVARPRFSKGFRR